MHLKAGSWIQPRDSQAHNKKDISFQIIICGASDKIEVDMY